MSENVLPTFSSQIFMVSCLIFKSLGHSEFIFVYGVRVCSNFIDLHVAVQLFQHNLLTRLSFSIGYSCLLCRRLIDHRCVGLFWALYSVPLIHVSVFVLIPHCFDYCSFVVLSKVWEGNASCFWEF